MSGCAFHFRGNGRYGTGLFGVVSMLVGCPIIVAFTGWVFGVIGAVCASGGYDIKKV